MPKNGKIYFVSDVHLGLGTKDPLERETRFVNFLKSIDAGSTHALYLLGDIWDFWYEYRDVVPKEGFRVVAQLTRLVDEGVKVYFLEGNHDIWTYSFFEELGIVKLTQPHCFELAGKTFCIGHGDCLGGAKPAYLLMQRIFHSRCAQFIFSLLHPWIAFRLGNSWSDSSRRSHKPYSFCGKEEPLYKFTTEHSRQQHFDYFIFGHFHDRADIMLPTGSRLIVLKDWMDGGWPCAVFDGDDVTLN